MDDFNREKRIFTVDALQEFVKTCLQNYYGMNITTTNEFEDYTIKNEAKLWTIAQNSDDQNSQAESLTYYNYTKAGIKVPADKLKEALGPFAYPPAQFKAWI